MHIYFTFHYDVIHGASHTVKYGALRIAFKKFAGDFCPDSLGQIRNQGGRPAGPPFPKAVAGAKFFPGC